MRATSEATTPLRATLSSPPARLLDFLMASEHTKLIHDKRKESPPLSDDSFGVEQGSEEEEPLAAGGAVNIWSFRQSGYLAQYFAVGLIYGGLPATVYGFFIGYLNVPAYVYSTAGVIMSLPWSFKFLFGVLNDCVPIMGYRRKPYMCIGWGFCCVMLLILSSTSLPPPYWCIDEATGAYRVKEVGPDGTKRAATPCHPDSARRGGQYGKG